MKGRCSNSQCFVHDGEACALGHLRHAECSSWTTTESKVEATASPSVTSARVPWSGSALGLADLSNLVSRGRSILVGMLGAHDAGKTTLLVGNYLQLLRGRTLAEARFAGSRTLGAWESLAAWTRFDDAARPPSFPPHTPRGTSRVPGLLHLALRDPKEDLRDLLLTDAPGEWFTRWSIQEDAPDAEGARWIVRHADAFMVLADSARLSGPTRGQARNEVRQLLERLGNHVDGRPTVLVWSKADHKPGEVIREALRRALDEHIPHATQVECSTESGESLATALDAAVRDAWTPARASPVLEPVLQHQPFAVFRGTRAHS
ncbi:GTPase domain-containing protein [Myxococcus sp. AB024B]|uniref:TRAFAC clade GTPase domain-containing protein n=1 Tax=Myxococcus sp. AB036A TaxID=2562793 RepID=UPI0011465F08